MYNCTIFISLYVCLSYLGHAMPVRSLCFSPDSQLLVTGSDDKDMKIYDVYVINIHNYPLIVLMGHE